MFLTRKLILFLLCLFTLPLCAQQGNMVVINFAGAPTGSCSPIAFAKNVATGDFYDCLAGSWNLIGGGSAPGTVTSVSGTTNQINVATGTTTPVVSISSTLIVPGTFSSAQAGAASTPAMTLSGAPFTGGTGTTTFPLIYLNSGASAPTDWATTGTAIGINLPSSSTADFLRFHVNGASSVFNVTSTGATNASGNVSTCSSCSFIATTRSRMVSPSDGVWTMTPNAGSGNAFTRLQFGGTTSSFPALGISGTTITAQLADGTTGGTFAAALYGTAANCAAAGTAANPSVASCSAAAAGAFSCATNASTGTCTVNTTAVTANSVIFVQPDSSLGTRLSVTCNTTADTGLTAPRVSARSAATSFTITLGTFATNPLCFNYWVVN